MYPQAEYNKQVQCVHFESCEKKTKKKNQNKTQHNIIRYCTSQKWQNTFHICGVSIVKIWIKTVSIVNHYNIRPTLRSPDDISTMTRISGHDMDRFLTFPHTGNISSVFWYLTVYTSILSTNSIEEFNCYRRFDLSYVCFGVANRLRIRVGD